jgi:hypothetical protein
VLNEWDGIVQVIGLILINQVALLVEVVLFELRISHQEDFE